MKLKNSQSKQKYYYDRNAHDLPILEEGDTVRMKPFMLSQKEWQKGQVTKRLDERSYEVTTPSGIYRRNRVHLKKTSEPSPVHEKVDTPDRSIPESMCESQNVVPPIVKTPVKQSPTVHASVTPVRKPHRDVKKPKYLNDYVAK
jgi:hypothetical protein